MKIIYKHKKTGKKVLKNGENYIFIGKDNSLPKDMIENTMDWELISPKTIKYELFKNGDKVYFQNIITEQEFHIGDKVTIIENMRFEDGKRNFKIKSFNYYKKKMKFHDWIYIKTNDDRDININDLIKL
jgi:hypothetical protein